MVDQQIRHPHDPAPLIPGSQIRFRWPGHSDPNVRKVRSEVQDGGPGMYVLYTPQGDLALVEAYYPDGIKASYHPNLDPFRQADHAMGRLVVINVLKVLDRDLDRRDIEEMRRNNRAFNPDLKSSSSAHARKLEIEDENEKDFVNHEFTQRFQDMFADAVLETRKFAMGKPRVGVPAQIN